MNPTLLKYLHELFAFLYVGAILSAHWNVLAARRTTDWNQRAALFALNKRLGLMFAVVPLVLLGVVGHILAGVLGLGGGTLRLADELWFASLILSLALEIPTSARLAALAANATAEPEGWNGLLVRWRLANGLQLLLFLVLLYVMSAPWNA